ncbi:hypothetical protein QL285_057699 [Trifolium repens]|nr:hypothetical protein QL285_057699 [Trifolium repens]
MKVDTEEPLKAPHQPQKKKYKVVNSNKKASTPDPVVEVVNLENSTPPKVAEIDPILEGLLRNIEVPIIPAVNTVLDSPALVVSRPLVQITNVDEIHSSSDSEFVDATQPEFNEVATNAERNNDLQPGSPTVEISKEISSESVTPARIAKDMVFLKNSWATLAEQEPDDSSEDDLVDDIVPNANTPAEKNVDIPFQVVSKRKNKKKKHIASNTYSTRSKVGQPSGVS